MKKYTILFFATVSVLLVFVGCEKADKVNGDIQQKSNAEKMTLYAYSQPREKIGLDGEKNLVWSEEDQIKVFSPSCTQGVIFTLVKGAGTNYGEFEGESIEGPYAAACCLKVSNTTSTDGDKMSIKTRNTQVYMEDTFAPGALPVVAYSSTADLKFKNTVGILRVGLKVKSGTNKVTSMMIKDRNCTSILWGTFSIDSNSLYGIEHVSNGDNTLMMDLGEGVTLNSSEYTYFYFCLPVGSLADGFLLYMTDEDGKKYILDYESSDKVVVLGAGKTVEQTIEFVTPVRPACQMALDSEDNWVTIGGLKWLNKNLRCIEYDSKSERAGETLINGCSLPPYYTDPTTIPTGRPSYMTEEDWGNLGMLYNFAALMGCANATDAYRLVGEYPGTRQGICPNGSHIPSRKEFDKLVEGAGSQPVYHLKNTSGWNPGNGDNSTGFSALAAGYDCGGTKDKMGYGSYFILADTPSANYMYYRSLTSNINDKSNEFTNGRILAMSVRCVKD